MDVGGAGRRVEDKVVQFAPVGVGNELLQCVRGHAAAPQRGRVGVDEEADGEYLHTVFIGRDEELPPVALFGEDAFRLQVEHFGNGRPEDVGIEQSDLVAELGQGHRQVGGHGALAHAAFAGTDGDDVLHLRQHLAGFGPGGLQSLGVDGHLYRLVHIGVDGGFGSLDHGFEERIGLFLEDKGKAHAEAVDAEVVLHHPRFHEVLPRAGIAHGGQCVSDEFGIELHGLQSV